MALRAQLLKNDSSFSLHVSKITRFTDIHRTWLDLFSNSSLNCCFQVRERSIYWQNARLGTQCSVKWFLRSYTRSGHFYGNWRERTWKDDWDGGLLQGSPRQPQLPADIIIPADWSVLRTRTLQPPGCEFWHAAVNQKLTDKSMIPR